MRQLNLTKRFTTKDSDYLDRYLYEIGKIEQIDAQREKELSGKIKQGDKKALDTLVRANLRFVVTVAKQYQNLGLSLADLICEGNYGLIKAAKKFDETKGIKFISYAIWWIRQAILLALTKKSRMVSIPVSKMQPLSNVRNAKEFLEQLYQREPSVSEIAEFVRMPDEEVAGLLRFSDKHLSLDAPIRNGEDGNYYEFLFSENSRTDQEIIKESLMTEIKRILNSISPRAADVLIAYFGLNGKPAKSYEEIGYEYNLTYERIRQIKKKH